MYISSAELFLYSTLFLSLNTHMFLNDYLEGGEGKKRNINVWEKLWPPPVPTPTRDQNHNPDMCPDLQMNP